MNLGLKEIKDKLNNMENKLKQSEENGSDF